MEAVETLLSSQPLSETMNISSNETILELNEEIKKMNENLKAASFAINNLTMQLNKTALVNPIPPPIERDISASTVQATLSTGTLEHGEQADVKSLGYVNWNQSHDSLTDQHLVQMVYIRSALEKLENISSANRKVSSTSTQLAKYRNGKSEEEEEEKTENDIFSFKQVPIPVVGKENRFPQDAVYIDVNSPQIKVELDFMNKLFVPPTEGVLQRFIRILESAMQTCESFEKRHGLKWV